LLRNRLLKHVNEGEIKGRIEVRAGRGGRRHKQIEKEEDTGSFSKTLRKRDEIEKGKVGAPDRNMEKLLWKRS
jgi:hypothetical protein